MDILEELLQESPEIELAANNLINAIQFYGKTLYAWSGELHIDIPEDPTPKDLLRINAKYTASLQKVNLLHNAAQALYTSLTKTRKEKQESLAQQLRASITGEKTTAKEIQGRVQTSLKDVTNMITLSQVIRDYFRNERETLLKISESLARIGYASNMDIKLNE